MRSKRVPARAASTTARTAMRTSSSASVVDTTSRPIADFSSGAGGRAVAGTGPSASASATASTSASAPSSPVSPITDLDRPPLADRGQQLQLERSQPLRQVDDDARRAVGQVAAGTGDRRRQQVALVVPVGAQGPHHLGGDARRLAAALGPRQRGDRARPGDAQLAVQVAQGDDGGGVVLDAGVQARVGVHDLAHGDVDHRRRHRLAARRGAGPAPRAARPGGTS